jgi:very-short-patch-repair endonuclease
MHACHALSGAPLGDGPIDVAIAALAARQGGVVSAAQLYALGLGRGAIAWRLRTGRLHRVHHGVYAVGHPRLTPRGRYWAAVLACGGEEVAVLSHRSAAAVWDLLSSPAKLDITSLRRSTSTAAIRVHRSKLRHDEIARHEDGLPTTSLARTLVDLGDVLTPDRLRRACHRAEILRLLDSAVLESTIARTPGRRTRHLQQILAGLAATGPNLTRSELEERFLSLIARFQLPQPLVNQTVEGHEVDFLWPAQRLIVETDGAAAHLTASAFERDRRRDAALQIAGYRIVRFTWRQITEEPHTVAATMRALLD